jgi:hypothetical protein
MFVHFLSNVLTDLEIQVHSIINIVKVLILKNFIFKYLS